MNLTMPMRKAVLEEHSKMKRTPAPTMTAATVVDPPFLLFPLPFLPLLPFGELTGVLMVYDVLMLSISGGIDCFLVMSGVGKASV